MIIAFIIALLAFLVIGIPIFASLGLVSMGLAVIYEGTLEGLADTVFASINSPIMATIPLFVLMARIMIKARVVDDLFNMANAVVGHVRGGLAIATILSCGIFATMSGSSVATALTIGSAALPQMKRYGYPDRDAFGVIAAGGTLGILIPPSGPMIVYAVVSDASIGALFLAGIIPGVVLALLFAIFASYKAHQAPDIKKQEFPGFKALWAAVGKSIWIAFMPPIILGGIYTGVFTATEAAGVGALYSLVIAAFVYKQLSLKDFFDCCKETVYTTSMVLLIVAAASLFGHALTLLQLPAQIMSYVTSFGLSEFGFLLVVMAVIFVMGMFLEGMAIILITTPIVLPTLIAMDINLVWYGIMLMINLELSMVTPPVGMNLFVIKALSDRPITEIIRGAVPYVGILVLGIALGYIFPPLALFLPELANFKS